MQKNTAAIRLVASVAVLIFSLALTLMLLCRQPHTQQSTGTATDAATEKKTETNTAPSQAEKEPELSAVPSDIIEMKEQFLKDYSETENKSSIREVFFVSQNSTDIIDNVAIRNTTENYAPDFRALTEQGSELDISDVNAPTVLVFHTHTTETYTLADNGYYYGDYPTHCNKEDRNMLRIGSELCAVLENRGIGCIHDENTYDENYSGAYARSREAVLEYLDTYPSIKIVLDVHRDAISENGERIKPTAVINGKKAAQIMILTGAEEGDITDFPNWESNLRFALCLQALAQEKYTGLMKPIFFCPRKYNMDTAKCSVLLEIGTESNTLEEAVYSARLMGDVIADMIERTVK